MKRLVLLLALLLAWSGPVLAAEDPGLALDRILTELERSAAGIETLASDFVQEKHLEMFQETLVSRGRFYFSKPDKLRWEMTEPVASGFLLNGDSGQRWHERAGAAVPFDIAREPGMRLIAEQLLAWARVDIVWLVQQYRMTLVSETPVTLKLVPLQAGAEAFLDYLQISFDPQRRHVETVEVHEPGGDSTRIVFSGTELNQPLDPALF
ncbi:outer membrane lipoprotein carrier protein LolA [Trichloromonas sp.]|uniref:outer membrane lipoprotein carrier protein LolA n=1 Tax=Trichloromonas sp. TaxID=3069249 RepID=UPI003D814C98